MEKENTTVLQGDIAEGSPFSILVLFKNNPPTVEDMTIGGQVAREFFNMIGQDAEGFPDCVESVTIKRSK